MSRERYDNDKAFGPIPVTESKMHRFAQEYFKLRGKTHKKKFGSSEYEKGRKKYKQAHKSWQASMDILKE